jgi:hypothetical protein
MQGQSEQHEPSLHAQQELPGSAHGTQALEPRLTLGRPQFGNVAAMYDGVPARHNRENRDELQNSRSAYKSMIRISKEEEEALIKHTPAGYEGPLAAAEALQDAALVEILSLYKFSLDRDSLGGSKVRWREIYEQSGYPGLARQVMEDEIRTLYASKPTLNEHELHWTAETMTKILQSTYATLLQSIMFGNLASDRRNDPLLAAILDKL